MKRCVNGKRALRCWAKNKSKSSRYFRNNPYTTPKLSAYMRCLPQFQRKPRSWYNCILHWLFVTKFVLTRLWWLKLIKTMPIVYDNALARAVLDNGRAVGGVFRAYRSLIGSNFPLCYFSRRLREYASSHPSLHHFIVYGHQCFAAHTVFQLPLFTTIVIPYLHSSPPVVHHSRLPFLLPLFTTTIMLSSPQQVIFSSTTSHHHCRTSNSHQQD